ncbi:MAG: histidinol dehydrogenase [Hirschia sp.]|nr:histidinol dehydrogenase [Hirschia sp.]MBF17270.1 histidinol dehydrogenase [Hirschia sp.]
MARWFDARTPQGAAEFAEFLKEPRGGAASGDINSDVAGIVANVRERGAEAVVEYTTRFDRLDIETETLSSPQIDLEALAAKCPDNVRAAIDFAAKRIDFYHRKQVPEDHSYEDDMGLVMGWRWTAIDAVGLYVPGGRASYPSSVLMNAIPARAAGVERLVMVAPAPNGVLNPAVAYAAQVAGVTEYYPIGGAQAVAALAYGAGPLLPVDKIVGPGNAYVAAAKRLVFGDVGIDTIAGPSEICVVADRSIRADIAAADLLSQAEHDPAAQSILITADEQFASQIEDEIARLLEELPTREVARQSWDRHGAIVLSDPVQFAFWVNKIAPEHVELAVEDLEPLLEGIKHAGAVFVGAWAPEALGDYVTGSNHVLPTSGAARFASGLSLIDFMKRTSIQRISAAGFQNLADAAERLASAEGLPAHERSISIRRNSRGGGDE